MIFIGQTFVGNEPNQK